MGIDPMENETFSGLVEFCLKFGFISVIGFVSVNIFRREPFVSLDFEKYMGTMYPQLGGLLEAFHHRPVLLLSTPLVCHRTQTAEEKKAALGNKRSEADFMADIDRRNALYFSHPYISMVMTLIELGAFTADDIVEIRENTVINGRLVDFFIHTVGLSRKMGLCESDEVWSRTHSFFEALPLDADTRDRINTLFAARGAASITHVE